MENAKGYLVVGKQALISAKGNEYYKVYALIPYKDKGVGCWCKEYRFFDREVFDSIEVNQRYDFRRSNLEITKA